MDFAKLRHAHSHLMYLGWLVPAVLLTMSDRLYRDPRVCRGARSVTGLNVWVALAWLTGVLTFPAFLRWGYEPVALASRQLPVGAILSGLCVLTWYGFFVAWWRRARHVSGSLSTRLWTLSLTMLVVASTGGWAQMVMNLRGWAHPFWSRASIHIFLDTLALGFVVPAVLGSLVAMVSRGDQVSQSTSVTDRRAAWALALAVPFTFLLGMSPERVTGAVRVVAGAAGFVTAASLVQLAWPLRRSVAGVGAPALRWPLRLPAAALAGGLALAAAPGGVELFHRWELRLVWLHLVFLVCVTPLIIALAIDAGWQRWRGAASAMTYAATALLLGLIPLTALWPPSWGGAWAMVFALGTAALPLAVMAWVLVDATRAPPQSPPRRAPHAAPSP